MSRFAIFICLLLAPAAVTVSGQGGSRISADFPIVNFRLPNYTVPDGFRAWLVRGSEARVLGANDIDIKELTMTIYSGDAHERIETMILSPAAKIAPESELASGESGIRVINDNFEATGIDWHYDYKQKKVTIARHVRVVLHNEMKDLLK